MRPEPRGRPPRRKWEVSFGGETLGQRRRYLQQIIRRRRWYRVPGEGWRRDNGLSTDRRWSSGRRMRIGSGSSWRELIAVCGRSCPPSLPRPATSTWRDRSGRSTAWWTRDRTGSAFSPTIPSSSCFPTRNGRSLRDTALNTSPAAFRSSSPLHTIRPGSSWNAAGERRNSGRP